MQKTLNRIVKKKKYHKYVVIVPPSDVKKMGWKPSGQPLRKETSGSHLVLKPKKT